MTSQFIFTNNDNTTLAGPVSSVATTIQIAAGSGVLFPNPGANQIFSITLIDSATQLLNEICYCTGRSVDTLTVLRAQEGTTALNWLAGDFVYALVTAGYLNQVIQYIQYAGARIVTLSGVFVMTTGDVAIGLNRTTSIASSSTTLPALSNIGQIYNIEDLQGSSNSISGGFQAAPCTVNAPAGHTLAGFGSSVTLNVNNQCAQFRYYGSNLWSVNLSA